MIIIEGPDSTGKSTLANKLSPTPHHFTYESNYFRYIDVLMQESPGSLSVMDRWFLSETIYSRVLSRPIQFTPTEYRNMLLYTLALNPLVIMLTKKLGDYKDSYLPEHLWEACAAEYKHHFLHELELRSLSMWSADDITFQDVLDQYTL